MEKSPAKISIIVPVYRTEAYLPACVQSIRDQSFPDWELILVDDGSPDGCGALCDQLADSDGRIRVIHQANGGVSRARNHGMEEARGELLAFVDSDDRIEPGYLAFLMDLRKESGAPISACGYCEEAAERRFPCRPLPKELLSAPEFLRHALNEANGLCLSVWGCLIPAAFGLRFREDLSYSEDSLFFAQALRKAGRIAYRPDPLYLYNCTREGNTYTRQSLKKLKDAVTSRQEIRTLFAGEDPQLDAELLRVLTDLSLQAVRRADAEGKREEKIELLAGARQLCRSAVREPRIRKKDRLRLALLSLAPVRGAALWEKLRPAKET